MAAEGLWRMLHWGPMVAVVIIKWVSLATLYCASMLWPPANSLWGLVFTSVFSCFSSLTLYHFTSALSTGPGFLALGWAPASEAERQQLQFCGQCQGFKAPRSHHCRRCGRCVMKMDHHCPWINTCVGHKNHGHFIAFLASAVAGCSMATVSLGMSLYYGLNRTWYLYYGTGKEPQVVLTLWSLLGALFGLGLALGVVIAVGMLLVFQLKAIARNQTGIEDWIKEKADFRLRQTERKFTWPYDLGRWDNLKQVLSLSSCIPKGDGIDWVIVEDCDQYTLTREQLRQKQDKRERTREYQIVSSYSGYWFPLSQGCGVCCHPPCTDEPRIRLAPGHMVRVTRWKRYWLYGELDQATTGDSVQSRVRGWFPRQCAVEVVDPRLYEERVHKQASVKNGHTKKVEDKKKKQ